MQSQPQTVKSDINTRFANKKGSFSIILAPGTNFRMQLQIGYCFSEDLVFFLRAVKLSLQMNVKKKLSGAFKLNISFFIRQLSQDLAVRYMCVYLYYFYEHIDFRPSWQHYLYAFIEWEPVTEATFKGFTFEFYEDTRKKYAMDMVIDEIARLR